MARARKSAVHRRFKIQRQVAITARDRNDKKFRVASVWRTAAEADHEATAETLLRGLRSDQRHETFRIIEVWPPGAPERVLIGPK